MKPLSFKDSVRQAIATMLVRFSIAIFIITYFIFLFKTRNFWDIQAVLMLVIDVFSDPKFLKIWLLTFVGVVA